VFLRAKSKGVHVNTFIRVTGVRLVRLDPGEVRSFTLREAVLAVKLELSGDNGVLAPAVHVQRCLSEHEGAGIRHTGVIKVGTDLGNVVGGGTDGGRDGNTTKVDLVVGVGRTMPVSSEVGRDVLIHGTGILEEAVGINECTGVSSKGSGATEGMDGVGEGINGISVVEGLGTKHLEQEGIASQRRAVVDVLIGLDNPNELLNGVVEVELDLVGGRTNRLVACELELSYQVLVGVLGHSAAFISVQEHIVNVEGGSNQRLVVGNGGGDGAANGVLVGRVEGRAGAAVQGGNGPQALVNGADIKVDLDLVVLKGDQGEGKAGVGAKPELKRHVQGGLRKGVAGGTHLAGGQGVARGLNLRERGIGDEGKLGGVTNHLEVSALLLRSHCELVPDVHPVTVLAVNALATNLNLNLGDELFTGEI